jgi:hypothetical protein
MGAGFQRPTSPEAGFVKAIMSEIDKRWRPKSFVVPVVQADPPESDPTNLWMRADGRLRGRYWNGASYTYVEYPMRSDITAPPAVPAAPAVPTPVAAPRTYTGTYTATWSQTYKGDGSKRTDTRGELYLVYGQAEGDGVNGQQRSLVGFDYATIAADLASSTITKVELWMQNVHSYWESGVQVFFGMHNVTAEPGAWPGSGSLSLRRSVEQHYGKAEAKKVPLTVEFGQQLRAGTAKGIAIEAPSNVRDYYGYAAGVGSGYTPPQLIITYAK